MTRLAAAYGLSTVDVGVIFNAITVCCRRAAASGLALAAGVALGDGIAGPGSHPPGIHRAADGCALRVVLKVERAIDALCAPRHRWLPAGASTRLYGS